MRVKTKRGMVVIASDCCHLYSHIDEGRVFPITYSVGDTLEGYKTLKKLASSRHHIVPGHDPESVKIYPAAKPGLENWIVRLDVKPKSVLDQPQFRERILVSARRSCGREAAEDHARDAARCAGDFGRHGADRDARGKVGGKR